MKLFKRMRLTDRYTVEESREPNDEGGYLVVHETSTLHGYNYQRVFKGNFRECHKEKKRLEKERLKDIYK